MTAGEFLKLPMNERRKIQCTPETVAHYESMNRTELSDSPLCAEVKDGKIVISIGIDRLDCDSERTGIKISDKAGFAEDICRWLAKDNEIGATPLTDLLDAAMYQAICDGSIHATGPIWDEK